MANMPLWQEVISKSIGVGVLKEQYIVTQGIVIHAIGRLGNTIIEYPEKRMKEVLKGLKKINWRRNASEWRGRSVRDDGRIITNNRAIVLTCNWLKKCVGVKLSDEEQYEEDNLIK